MTLPRAWQNLAARLTSWMLTAGTHLGSYEVVAPLGAGGMGEVYRARDIKLGRDVAIKVLPEMFVSDPDRVGRFRREAKTLAALNHPNIAAIHGLEESNGISALVLEFVEGLTLAERISQGPIGLDEALLIARQIADALEAAHQHGIIHRDLKPANIKVRPDGTVKVLDFGLAKALSIDARVSRDQLANSPTITSPIGMTGVGVLLGTAAYMSPEQAKHGAADTRSDIWAFGCVLYEMLTGRRAFDGNSTTEVLARVIEREPDWTVLPHATPVAVRRLLKRALRKNSRRRLADIADARLEIDEVGEDDARSTEDPARFRTPVAAAVMMTVGIALGGTAAWQYARSRTVPEEVRFEVTPPPGTTWAPSPVASTTQLALSPDGRRLAVVAAARRGAPQLWIRSIDSIRAQPLAGTDGASFPFWSPDSRSIGFFADGKLKRVDTTGGEPIILADAPLGRGGSWNRDGVIVFAPSPPSGLWRVSAAGPGSAARVTTPDRDGTTTNHVWPQFLADGRRFVFYQRSSVAEHQGIYLGDLNSATTTRVVQNDAMGVVARGRLYFVRDGTLFAYAIDEASMRTDGDPVRVADQVGFTLGTIGYSPLAASGSTVAYGPSVRLMTALQWRDRTGAAVGRVIASGAYRSPRLSHDNQQIVLTLLDEQANSPDIWILDLSRGTFSKVTSDPSTDWFPVWGPGGDQVFFGSARTGATRVYRKNLADNAPEAPLIEPEFARYPLDVTSDGRLVYQEGSADGYDLSMIDLRAVHEPIPLISTRFNEVQARVAPNNRWVAYASDESGSFQIYVRALSGTGRQWPISPAGGMQPEWRRDGRELFYISRDRKLMSVPVTTDHDAFSAGVPQALFDVDVPEPNAPYPNDYAVSADGQRFLINTLFDQASGPSLTVILNAAP